MTSNHYQSELKWFTPTFAGSPDYYPTPHDQQKQVRKQLRGHNATAWSPLYKGDKWKRTGWNYYCWLYGVVVGIHTTSRINGPAWIKQ